jgi:hypothetical protein
VWPGKNEISIHVGGQAGLGGYSVTGANGVFFAAGGPPSGFKLLFDYSYRVRDDGPFTLWLNLGSNLTIGGGCNYIAGNHYYCGLANNGDTIEPFFGVKMKFRTPIPLVPYAKIDGTLVGIFARFCGDNGVAVAARLAGGLKYFLTRNVGVGAELAMTVGPGFYGGASAACTDYYYGSHVELYAAFDLGVGAEFVF